jgi:hypothetical protein
MKKRYVNMLNKDMKTLKNDMKIYGERYENF